VRCGCSGSGSGSGSGSEDLRVAVQFLNVSDGEKGISR
jgi:hypothetical protein